ncbi:transmembrane protein 248-like [Mya arenaria]|uniref:transmembrane protein 248-like n=1 Tax=Mya arenaria TaxID=6604 RepID=UPI0022DF0017|nr:transmembrane protein 248-like [Mya arenaria]
MCKWLLCENLRGFISTRPPLVLFMLLLGIFAATLLSLAYIIKTGEYANPDETDWNDFLSSFKKVQFCMVPDGDNVISGSEPIAHQNMKDVVSKVHDKLPGAASKESTTTVTRHDVVQISVPFWVEVQPTLDFVSIPHNVSSFSTRMSGQLLGLQGADAESEFNVTMKLPFQWNASLCYSKEKCKIVKIKTCLVLEAPNHLFPQSRAPSCSLNESVNSTSDIENQFRMVSKQRSLVRPLDMVCNSMPSFTVDHKLDPKLTIMLSLQDQSAINLHLVHTSYFLFVMVITLLAYASVKGRSHAAHKVKGVHYTEVSHAI